MKAAGDPMPGRWRLPFLAAAALAVIVALTTWFYLPSSAAERDRGGIVVVRGSGAAPPSRQAAPPAQGGAAADAATTATPDAAALGALKRSLVAEFPTLKDATISCAASCVLVAPLSTRDDARLAEAQLPYMGRLERAMVRYGFAPIDGLMIEETGAETVSLRLSFESK